MHFPTWVDLKGEDSVPETVHHVVMVIDKIYVQWYVKCTLAYALYLNFKVVMIDPRMDTSWTNIRHHVQVLKVDFLLHCAS